MNHVLRRTLSLTATALLALVLAGGTSLAVGAAAASAAGASAAAASARPATATTTPPWEPDPDSVGGLVFYNSSGEVITGGSTTAQPVAAYVEGTTTIRAGDDRATLYGYLPVHGQSTGEYQGEALGASTTYPNGAAPAPLNSATLPLETGGSTDESIATLALDFPNLDTSSDGYAGMYQLRLRTSGPDEGLTQTYDSADIEITGSTWSVVYSAVSTTTALAVSPKSPAKYGTKVTLTGTVTPSSATGSVDFKDGTKLLGAGTLTNGVATLGTTTLPAGTHKLTAVYVPAAGSSDTASVSSVHDLTIDALATTTSLKAAKSSITSGQSLKLSATEAPSTAGSVAFYDGSKKLAAVKVAKGAASYTTTKLPVGTDSLKAVFTPSATTEYAASTSKVVKVTVKK